MNLYLIGYRGSGKTTVAPLIAKALNWETRDSDSQIEVLTSRTITEIFSEDGETVFREWETTVIQALAVESNKVISVGGGAPISATNRQIMKASGCSVWLQASAEELWRRISEDPKSKTTRPNLTNHTDGIEEVRQVLLARRDAYMSCADYMIQTGGRSPAEVADQIANWWDPVDTH